MPTYDYMCDAHGAFSSFKPISQYKDPQPCPDCGEPSPRVMLTAPTVRGTGQPASAGGSPAWLSGMKRHSGGCACC